ncbi:alpha/beta fold hydrolase [Curtobacterium sp. Csp1]|uniref:epoxide hydrolase family protein n=1 Tax=unclassified Curtobacterium TaxID=257496 RepID=UPI001598CDEF|nr:MULTISPECIES: epoxide hydrolase [unclassified Curtobacterium]QKS13212.1 alpha/beta fold hydrolase [Curtobacterium sp. csp3]QKS19453.1 alpha/beta fold hydrolase [Curtobacterium sp. Csp1]
MSETPDIDDATIADLRARLRATRWPDATGVDGWSLGVDLDELRPLVAYWADGFDFDAHRAALAALPSRLVEVDGIRVHVLHARSGRDDAIPLLLAHGWPDSGWRYRKVLPMLVAAGFDVVVPDMPGYGFSDAPPQVLDARQVAGMWAELMTTLGYERFAASGGDIGTHVVRYLALDQPDRVVAVHRIDGGLAWPGLDASALSPTERAFVDETARWRTDEGAYAMLHRTKPQTAAVGLTDSPAGTAAWIVEKLRSWSDCGGDLWSVYTRDEVLALLTEYWATGTIGSSMRMYHANAAIPAEQLARRVEVPSGFSVFPGDLVRAPREWLERTTNLVYHHELDRGGHFATVEVPELYVSEVRTFLEPYRR